MRPRAPEVVYEDSLRTSERGAINRCRQRWDWSYNQRLRLKREKPALRFGTLIHKALEHYYGPVNQARRKPVHPAVTFARLFDEELEETEKEWDKWRDEDDEWHTYRELGIVMMQGYADHWKEQDKEYITVAVEQRFHIKILVPRGEPALVAPSPTMYVGTIDRVLYHLPSRRLLFGDYKTTKNDPTKNAHLALDEQAGAYLAYGTLWLAGEAPTSLRKHMAAAVAHLPPAHRKAVENLNFDGILYDFLKKSLPDERPVNDKGYYLNQNGSVSKQQPGPLFHRETVFRDSASTAHVKRRIYEDAKEIGQLRSGTMAIKKSPDRFICIGCQFIDVCELHEVNAPGWEEYLKVQYERYNPYSTYEIDADELA